jgi:hypothetical protein
MTDNMNDLYANTDSGLAAFAAGFLYGLPAGLCDVDHHSRAVLMLLALAGIKSEELTVQDSNPLVDANLDAFCNGRNAGQRAVNLSPFRDNHGPEDEDDCEILRGGRGHAHIGSDTEFAVIVRHNDDTDSMVTVRTDKHAMMDITIVADPATPYGLIQQEND